MEVKPAQLVAMCAVAFVGIVAAQMFISYQSNENFRERFSKLDFTAVRPRLLREEGISPVEVAVDDDDDEEE